MFSSYLYSIVLAAIFSAVCELVLPARFSSLGRLLRAVVSVSLLFLIASPLFSLFCSDVPEIPSTEFDVPTGDLALCEEQVTALALKNLEEQMTHTAKTLLGEECKLCVFVSEEDISQLFADIYCDSTEEEVNAACKTLFSMYGVTCRAQNAREGV